MLWLLYFCNSTGERTEMVDKAIKEIRDADKRYMSVNWMRINIDLEANQCQKYEIKDAPCIFAGKDTVFKFEEGIGYDEVKQRVQSAMDMFLNAAIL